MPPKKEKQKSKKTEQEKFLASYMEVWIVYILRTYSDKEHPMSTNEIVEKVTSLTGLGDRSLKEGNINSVAKTIGRRLNDLEMMGNYFDSDSSKGAVGEVFYRVVGGRIIAIPGRPARYYFEPILESGDVSLICAAVESNHYLSPEEKEYLVRRESASCSYKEGEDEYRSMPESRFSGNTRLPRKPSGGNDRSALPSGSAVTLKKISTLQYAIKKHLKIRVIPGTYYHENDRIVFGPKRERESILNPYAMICQNGQYYIIVTHEGYQNPTHYRVDRLYSVELIQDEGKKGTGYIKRDDIPTKLQRFFKGNKFQAEKYTSSFPLMVYADKNGTKKCEFLCKAEAVTVAIDYFGVGDTVKMSEPDKDDYVKFSVLADYNNVKFFCIQQYQIVVPLSPAELKEDVTDSLMEAIGRINL